MSEPRSGAEVLAQIKPRRRRVATNICLRPDLLDAWEDAQAELAEATGRNGVSRLASGGGSAKTRKIAERIQALEQELDETQFRTEFESMPPEKWSALTEKHPARKDNQVDMLVGYNRDAVADAAVRVCMVDPVFSDCATPGCDHAECGTWQAFTRVLNPSEWQELRDTAMQANSAVKDLPKSALAATLLTRRAAGSKPPKGGESVPRSSTGGPREKSTSTSTPPGT